MSLFKYFAKVEGPTSGDPKACAPMPEVVRDVKKLEVGEMRRKWHLTENEARTETGGGRPRETLFRLLLVNWLSMFFDEGGRSAHLPATMPEISGDFNCHLHRLPHPDPEKQEQVYEWVKRLVNPDLSGPRDLYADTFGRPDEDEEVKEFCSMFHLDVHLSFNQPTSTSMLHSSVW